MADAPPQLGNLPAQSNFTVPTLSSTGSDAAMPPTGSAGTTRGDTLQNAKATMASNASAAYNAVADHPVTQNVKETVNNGRLTTNSQRRDLTGAAPVTQAAKHQASITSDEFASLKNSRQTPATTAATGQNLTHYHSFFYDLLSWEHPRMSAIAYLTAVSTIFAARYVPVLPILFKLSAYVLGTVALTEGIAKLVLSQSLVASFRPKKYFTIPRETLESALEDVEQLINFFVIEFQRILFAENVLVTFASFLAAVIGYFMIKFTPFWGLCLMSVTTLFIGPLIYRTNQELIDHHIGNASDLINDQANQVRDLAGHHTSRATETLKSYTSEYSAKAQEMLGNAKRQATPASQGGVRSSDFPNAPSTEPAPATTTANMAAQPAAA